MEQKKIRLSRVCSLLGGVLIAASLVLLTVWQISVNRNAERIQAYVDTLYELIPEPQAAVMESRSNNAMPALYLQKEDFVAILEMPAHAAAFPVGGSWENHTRYPCLYVGSVYDGSLMIGTSNQKGQLDFVKEISVGNVVTITDMTGNCFSYEVSDIRYCKHADNDTLYSREDDLTIFVKNIYAFEYIILHCTAAGS